MELWKYGTTETRNLAASSGKTDLLNYGIMESNKPYKKGTTNKRNQESTDTRIYGNKNSWVKDNSYNSREL